MSVDVGRCPSSAVCDNCGDPNASHTILRNTNVGVMSAAVVLCTDCAIGLGEQLVELDKVNTSRDWTPHRGPKRCG